MLTVSQTHSPGFELPPAGPVAGRCSRLIDLGSQPTDTRRLQRKLLISWELAEIRSDGTPFVISRRFGLSLHEKSALRGFLQAWRGRPFTQTELELFDLRKLIGAPALINIVHVERAGKKYANIASISPLPRGMDAPPLSVAPVVFDIDADDAPAILETLSDGLRATITMSPEWQERIKASDAPNAYDAAPTRHSGDLDDDIPF